MIQFDESGTVINDEETYGVLAEMLLMGRSVVIAWTDREDTQLDIFMRLNAEQYGPVQGGITGTYLYVAIMRVGAFAFDPHGESSPEYYAEKFGMEAISVTTEKLAELLNGIRKAIKNAEGA